MDDNADVLGVGIVRVNGLRENPWVIFLPIPNNCEPISKLYHLGNFSPLFYKQKPVNDIRRVSND